MIGGLLRQVVVTDEDLPECLETAHKKFRDSSLPHSESQNQLVKIIEGYPQTHWVYIVLDALDECDEFKHRRQLLDFIRQLQQIPKVRLLMTSRQRPHDINAVFYQYPQLEIEAQDTDLSSYMYQQIPHAGTGVVIDTAFASTIVETIITQARGM